LRARFERAASDVERVVLAGALGLVGDSIGRPIAREMLGRDDPAILRRALEAVGNIGHGEDRDVVVRFLRHQAAEVSGRAVRALGRIGDRRSLAALQDLRARTAVSAIRASIEEAEIAIFARSELRGEDTTSHALMSSDPDGVTSVLDVVVRRAPFATRVRAWWDYLVGEAWLAFGLLGRAVARLERAATRRPNWGRAPVLMAVTLARRHEHARALAAFRRAVEADRAFVERHADAIAALARTFLARAEEVEREGRHDVALGLLGEALSLDLRRAPGNLRFELERRQESLRRDSRT
jgi:tetratricopeptide (TPR) repeat protein